MSKINLKGITKEALINVFILLLALVNAILQMLGLNVLPIENKDLSEIISILFLIATTLYNTYKNRNVSTASQIAQQVTDSIKNGEILVEEVEELLNKVKK
jgi:SPP1 family holin